LGVVQNDVLLRATRLSATTLVRGDDHHYTGRRHVQEVLRHLEAVKGTVKMAPETMKKTKSKKMKKGDSGMKGIMSMAKGGSDPMKMSMSMMMSKKVSW
jgi:hypothetical protein